MIGFKKIVASAIVATVCLSVTAPVFAKTNENQTANTADQTIFEIPEENTESLEQAETVVVDITDLVNEEETKEVEEKAEEPKKETTKKKESVKKTSKTTKKTTKKAKKEYLGKFTVYAYSSGGTTASGTKTKANRTVAVDPKVIPLGSKIEINGKIYVAEDTGGFIKGKKLDIYIPSEKECIKWGRRELKVYLVK